jgi:prepilin-type N-terminal cleavage/methylation domain-containing protein
MKGKFLSRKGFTIVELLVSVTILSLLVLAIVQITAFTGQAININSKNLDAAAQARLVLDRLGADFAARINRTDLPMTFTIHSGNDSFQFYSEVAGYTGDRQISTVGYRIGPTSGQLERGATGAYFGTGQIPQLTFLPNPLPVPPLPAPTLSPPAPGDFAVLAPGVFRLEVCYLIKSTGKLSNSLNGSFRSDGSPNPNDFSNVAAFVVAIAVLDTQSVNLLTTPNPAPATQLGNLAGAFSDTTEGFDPISAWNTTINNGLTVTGVPKRVCQNVHVYERTFYVP